MRREWWLLVMVLVGCTSVFAEMGKAEIIGTTEGSPVSGTATLTETPTGLRITIQVAKVPPGKHGLHIHQFGSCQDGGNAAGGHYNPDGVKHGYLPTEGFAQAHGGDLGNIDIGADGSGTLELVLSGLTLSGGTYNVAGRAIVLHEKVDDFGQPTGNAGGRIGCGSILITGE